MIDSEKDVAWSGSPEKISFFDFYVLGIIGAMFASVFLYVIFFFSKRDDVENWMYVFVGILFVLFLTIAVCSFFMPYLGVKTTRYSISDTSVCVERGIFSKRKTAVMLTDVRSVSVRQSLFGRIFGIGDVLIATAATTEEKPLITGIKDFSSVEAIIRSHR